MRMSGWSWRICWKSVFRTPDFCAGQDLFATVALDLVWPRKMFLETIEPQDGDFAIVGAQFSHLGMEIVQIALVVLVAIIRMAPVGLRVVTAKGQVRRVACSCQFGDNVTAKRRVGTGDLVIGQRRVKVAKAIVMLGGEDQVAHPSIFGDLHPFCGIELSWVEFFVQIVVLLYGHRAWWRGEVEAAPLAAARPADFGADQADRSPMNKEPEARRAPPLEAVGLRWICLH